MHTTQTKTESATIHFCEDCDSMLYSFCLVAHVHGPADMRSLEIVQKYHTKDCAWVTRAAAGLSK